MNKNKTVAIFGVNGFIGHHLLHRILETTNWKVIGFDMADSRIKLESKNKRFKF
jgi:UDP-4-amino-4-deoxy-L-arabinose formyltransferase/UDP-glucuronic acid dehydrogenase (UDP-4-keto-hexauronic acid decarboxylating)